MVRFSCFSHIHKPKKTLEDFSQGRDYKDASNSKSLNSALRSSSVQVDEIIEPAGSAALESGWKSEEITGKVSFEADAKMIQLRHLMRSQSLSDEVYLDGRAATEKNTDDGLDHVVSLDSPNRNGSVALDSSKFVEGISSNLYQTAPHHSVSGHLGSDQVNSVSVLSVGDLRHLEKEIKRCSDSSFSGDRANDSTDQKYRTSPLVITKSNSMPNIPDSLTAPGRHSPINRLALGYRSSDDLRVLDMRQNEKSVIYFHSEVRQEQAQADVIQKSENGDLENLEDNGYDCYGHSSFTKDWIVPDTNELNPRKYLQGEASVQPLNELSSKDFKNKRIKEWVNDLQHYSTLEEPNVLPVFDEAQRQSTTLDFVDTSLGDLKLTPGMEAAKKYISSLNASAAAAQFVNYGLVVIPFLSAFVSLRVLNLSGNAIVRITAGALPRGLHVLNLSKNSITTIEGLRELTRLRVLDLSYNRLLRIGHGLASCSSLKELYLAGNKISEVEGLHRLLKLTVLDLRYNKISTTKCLNQLAANYNSLQAISLEGNPAQKNVGDEQLKKYLLGHLPHLVYFNRQAIKTSSLKDAAERSIRLGRSELKVTRKSSHVATAHKPSSSAANNSRRNQIMASQKRPKDRNGRLPPSGVNGSTAYQGQYVVDSSNRTLNMKLELSIRRSRSEGTLGAL